MAGFLLILAVSLGVAIVTHLPLMRAGKTDPGPIQFFVTDFYTLFVMIGLAAIPVTLIAPDPDSKLIALGVLSVLLTALWTLEICMLSRARVRRLGARLLGQFCLPLQAVTLIPGVFSGVIMLDYVPGTSLLIFIGLLIVPCEGVFLAVRWVAEQGENSPASNDGPHVVS